MWFVAWGCFSLNMLNTLDVQKISPARDKCKEQSVAMQAICLSHKINWIQHVIAETSAEPRNTYPSPGDTPSLQSKQASKAEMHLDTNTA